MPNITTTAPRIIGSIISSLAVTALPMATLANPANVGQGASAQHRTTNYAAHLQPLNGSGAFGHARLSHQGNELRYSANVGGLEPGKLHPVHIHGKNHPEVATCPTTAVDTNRDGFVSVVEGAATYGPIKLNLTSPQTPFGAPPTLALFTPFAGTANLSHFPTSDASGHIRQNQTYVFDGSPAAQGALASLIPLEDQHIVVHGGFAPQSVDADAFQALGLPVGPLNERIYDPLLPVACGEIFKQGHQNTNHNAAVSVFRNQIETLTRNLIAAQTSAQATFRASNHSAQAQQQLNLSLQTAHNAFVAAQNQSQVQLQASLKTQ